VRKVFLLLLVCSACSEGPQADLPAISEARSLGAEWALINAQAAQHKITQTYAATMRASIREQLQGSAKALTQPNTPYGAEIRSLLREPDDAPAQQLRAHADNLKQIEDSLESA